MELAQELITEIFEKVQNLSDSDYCDVLEEVAGACEDAASAKRHEMESETEDEG